MSVLVEFLHLIKHTRTRRIRRATGDHLSRPTLSTPCPPRHALLVVPPSPLEEEDEIERDRLYNSGRAMAVRKLVRPGTYEAERRKYRTYGFINNSEDIAGHFMPAAFSARGTMAPQAARLVRGLVRCPAVPVLPGFRINRHPKAAMNRMVFQRLSKVFVVQMAEYFNGGRLLCWGFASFGSLGYGRGKGFIGHSSPASEGGRVPLGTDGSSPRLQLPGTGVRRRAVGVSSDHQSTCVLTAAREVLCWGGNSGQYLGYPGLGATCATATPADYGAVMLGGGGGGDEGSAAADPSVLRILWCDSHFGNASTLRSPASQQQQLASCALGFPFTLGVIGTPPSPHVPPPKLSLRRSSSDAVDTQCAVQHTTTAVATTAVAAAVVCSSGGSGFHHAHSGAHYLMASPAVRALLTRETQYSVVQATVPPVTTLVLDRSRTPFSTAQGLTNRRRLLFLLGSSRPTGAQYVITTTGATAGDSASRRFTTNSTRLWLFLTSEGAHNLTVYTVDAGGVEDPSPLTLRWLADFTPPSTAIVSGPTQPVAATATGHFKFGCSDSSSSRQQQQQAVCSYRVALRQLSGGGGGGGDGAASTTLSVGGGSGSGISERTLSVAPVTMLHAAATTGTAVSQGVSASPHISFHLSTGVGTTMEYRLIHGAAAGDTAPTVQHRHPWHTIAAADGGSGTGLTLRNLPDGAYVLQLRSGSGADFAVVAFSVDTTAPLTRVQNVTRRAASDGSSTAHWRVQAADLDCNGGSAVIALLWAAAGTAGTDADASSPAIPPTPSQWQRVNVYVAAAAAAASAVSLSAPLWATVLRVKVEDAAGNVDPFPRTISWGHALSLRSAPRATTFRTSATFSLVVATPSPVPLPGNNAARPPSLAVRWRLDGAAWQWIATTSFPAPIRVSALAPGPHVWEAQPVADDGSPDAVQSTPVYHTWQVLSSACLDCSGMTFTDLPDGSHELVARAVDVAGNVDSGNATYHWRIDTTPPSCSAAVEWRAAGGSSGGDNGRLYVNGSEAMASVQLRLGNASSASASAGDWSTIAVTPPRHRAVTFATAVTHEGLHILSVKATDVVGNAAALPCAVLRWLVDSTPPIVSLLPPLGVVGKAVAVTNRRVWNATVSARDPLSPVVSMSYAAVHSRERDAQDDITATANAVAARWEAVPLVALTQQPSQGSVTVPVLVSVPGDGRYSLWLKAVDAAGNVAVAPAVFNWTVDTTPPVVTLHATHSGAPLPSVIAQHWLLVCLHLTEPLASLRWAVSEHLSFPQQQQLLLPAWVAEPVRSGASHHCMNVTVPSGAADGQYALALKATDFAGNSWRNNTAYVWRVDTVAPTSCTVSTPSTAVNNTSVPVSFGPFDGPQGIVGHWYALVPTHARWVWRPTNGVRSVVVHMPTPVGQDHTTLQHVLKVKAVDAAGNVGSQPCASLSVTIDTTPPVSAVYSPSQGAALRISSPRITLHHSEPVARVRWWWQDGSGGARLLVPSTPPYNATSLHAVGETSSGDGLRSIWIQAEDGAGNLEATPVRFSWVKDTVAPSVGLVGSSALSSQSRVAAARLELVVAVTDNNGMLLEGRQSGAGVWYSAHRTRVAADVAAPHPALQWIPVLPPVSAPAATKHRLPITVTVSDDGWYCLALKAVDAAGNSAVNSSALRWAVDTTPPTADIASVPRNTTLGRTSEAPFSFRCTSVTACKPWGGSQPCAPVEDCASYRYRVVATADVGGDSGCSGAVEVVPWTTSSSRHVSLRSGLLRAGSLRLEVKAVDAVGLLQLRASVHTWAVSPSQEVVVSVATRPPPLSAWDMAPFTFQASMGGAPYSGQRFQLRVDTETGPWQTLTLCQANQSTCSHLLRGIARGSHVVHARAVDVGSGIASAPVSVRWTLGVCNATAYAQVSPSNGALRCILCPAGANCTADDVTLPTMGAQTGWWAAAGRAPGVRFYACPLPGSCEGGGNATEASACAPIFNSSSVMCGGCAAGHVRQKQRCTACPEAAVGVALAVLCTLLLVAFICFSVSSSATTTADAPDSRAYRESASVLQRILISFLSTLTTIGDFRARGPQLVQDFIGLTSTVSGGVSVRFAPIRCTLGLGFFAELLATLGMPLFLLCCCAIVVTARSRLQRHFRARQEMLGCAVFTAFLVYPTLTRATLQVFRCTDVEVDGSRYLLHDLQAQCFRGTHSVAVLVSALATAVVGLGVPAAIITRVATHKTSGARLRLKRTFEFIFDGYLADRLLWWEALVLLRKFALQCVEVFISDATIQAAVASWIIVAAVALHLWWRPYNSALLNQVDAVALLVSYVTQALSSAYPVLLPLSGGGGGPGYAEAVVTVVLLGLNIGVILTLVVLVLRMSLVLYRRRRASALSSHPVAAISPRVAGCSSVAVAQGGTATASALPLTAVASFGAGREGAATATTTAPAAPSAYPPAAAVASHVPYRRAPPPRGGRRRQHSHVASHRRRHYRHSHHSRRRTTVVARSGKVVAKRDAAEAQ